MEIIAVTDKPLDIGQLTVPLADPSCGGVVTFVGRVRNHDEGREITGLTYEAFVPMTLKIFRQIAVEVKERFGVATIAVVHRTGELKVGEVAVWIGVQAAHRREAFAACTYAIDEIKSRAPIWKKEHYITGESQWVSCHH